MAVDSLLVPFAESGEAYAGSDQLGFYTRFSAGPAKAHQDSGKKIALYLTASRWLPVLPIFHVLVQASRVLMDAYLGIVNEQLTAGKITTEMVGLGQWPGPDQIVHLLL